MVQCSINGDIVHLKNGRSFEGKITEKTPTLITLQEDALTLTFHRSRIDRIEEKALPPPTPKAEKEKTAAGPGETPREFEGFFDELHKLNSAQITTGRAKSQVVKIKRQIALFQKQEAAFENERTAYRNKASDTNNSTEYNKYIQLSNSMISKINAKQAERAAAYRNLAHTEKSLNAYANQASRTQANYEQRLTSYLEHGPSQQDQAYFRYIRTKMEKHREAFKTSFQFYNGSSLIVRARLNKKVFGTFIVDTGASIVTIHRDLARQLKLDLANAPVITASLADGSTSEMPSIFFDSVSVNGSTALHIEGAVSDHPPSQGVDGLLGMSFLSHFDFKLDIQQGRLILQPLR